MDPQRWIIAIVATCGTACALSSPDPATSKAPPISLEVYRRAETERAERLELEVQRLRDDLQRAEEALVAAESGLRGDHSRADAVSTLAATRIQVERAAAEAPWRSDRIEEARTKLDEADHQVKEGHFGAALFFVYRARRIADDLTAEASSISSMPGARFVKPTRLNLRAGPSTDAEVVTVLTQGSPVFPESHRGDWILVRTTRGAIGWVHADLIQSWPETGGPADIP